MGPSVPNCTSSHTIYLSQIFITFVILQSCNIPRLLSISSMLRKLRRHKQQNNLDYKRIVCLPQVCHCLIIQHVLHLHPLQNVPIRSPSLLLQMFLRFQHQNMRLVECKFNKNNIVVKVYINCIAVYGILSKLCHFCTARIKIFKKLKKKKSSSKTETQI